MIDVGPATRVFLAVGVTDRLFQRLVSQLVQRHKHQGPALALCRRRLDQQVWLTALLIDAFLHRPHAEFVRMRGTGIPDVSGGDGGKMGGTKLWRRDFQSLREGSSMDSLGL